MPGGSTLVRRDTLFPRRLDGVDSSILFENDELELYSELLHSRQIELTLQHALLDPALLATTTINGIKNPFIEKEIKWKFDPLENATHCPEPSRVLPYDFSVKQEKWSLKTVEAEE